MRNIDILKQVLKKMARDIRGTRYQFKEAQRSGQSSWKLLSELRNLQSEYRHHHIAYSELRGRTRDEIETKPKSDKKHYICPSEAYIQQLKDKYAWSEEDIATYNERKAKKNEAVHS